MNPRANGIVERVVREVKAGLRRLLDEAPAGSPWWEYLPDVLRAIRCLPSRATGTAPYLLVFKQPPPLPIRMEWLVEDEEKWGAREGVLE